MLTSQKHIKERRKRRQWMCPLIRKGDSKEAYYLITIGLGLTDKEDFSKFRYSKKKILFQKIMFPLFLYKVLYNSCLLLFLRHWIQKQKKIFYTSEALPLFTPKNNICKWIKLNWFDFNHYTENVFLSKIKIFLYFKNIFYNVILENIFRILNNSVYFQNIVV